MKAGRRRGVKAGRLRGGKGRLRGVTAGGDRARSLPPVRSPDGGVVADAGDPTSDLHTT